jgi:hypothetical protein
VRQNGRKSSLERVHVVPVTVLEMPRLNFSDIKSALELFFNLTSAIYHLEVWSFKVHDEMLCIFVIVMMLKRI